MSGTQGQRMRRMPSPSTKQGPLKAIQTFGLKPGSPTSTSWATNGRSKNSPSSSPTPQWGSEGHRKARKSPDHRVSPDRAGSNSPGFKAEKTKGIRHSPGSRPGSVDSFQVATHYMQGDWPRLPAITQGPQSCDQCTQTPNDWEEGDHDRKKKSSHRRSSSLGNDETIAEKFKARMAKTNKESGGMRSPGGMSRTSPVPASHITLPASANLQSKAVSIPIQGPKPSMRMRGSVEGPSQEIEKLVCSHSGIEDDIFVQRQTQDPTPDGHRAPVRDLLAVPTPTSNMRSVDTQTPQAAVPKAALEERHTEEDHQSDNSSDASPLPFASIPTQLDSPHPSTQSDSSETQVEAQADKENDSPHPKSFSKFIREPPDGCERVPFVEEPSQVTQKPKEAQFCPIQNIQEKCRIPSAQSAFYKIYVSQPSEMALKTKAAQEDITSTGSSPVEIK